MEAFGIGDLHLTSDKGKGGLAAYISDSDDLVANLVIKVLDRAIRKGITNIFLYGDLCEGPRMSYEAQRALHKIFTYADLKFYVITGNHDIAIDKHSLEVLEFWGLANVKVFTSPKTIKVDDAKVRFLPYPHDDFDESCLNVGHVGVEGARADNNIRIKKSNNSPAVIVMGHIHTRQRVRDTHYSGTLYQTDFGESPDKFFHHIQFINPSNYEVTCIPSNPSITLCTLEVMTKEDIPKKHSSLIKLILLEGSTVVANDYKHLNVVRVRPTSSERDLALARIEALHDGEAVTVSSSKFFKEWLDSQSVDDSLKRKAYKLRKELL